MSLKEFRLALCSERVIHIQRSARRWGARPTVCANPFFPQLGPGECLLRLHLLYPAAPLHPVGEVGRRGRSRRRFGHGLVQRRILPGLRRTRSDQKAALKCTNTCSVLTPAVVTRFLQAGPDLRQALDLHLDGGQRLSGLLLFLPPGISGLLVQVREEGLPGQPGGEDRALRLLQEEGR